MSQRVGNISADRSISLRISKFVARMGPTYEDPATMKFMQVAH
jgi:hypothetical protein